MYNQKSHMIHGAGIFANANAPKKSPSYVGKYSSTMDHMGMWEYIGDS